MPAKVKVKILACRNLPVMDRSNDTTDAFVEVKLGNVTFKTDVKRKTLHPIFNSNWFRFEIDDLEIQDEPLTIRVMDYDTYSANDAIGKVSLSLSPLLLQKDISRGMNGWIPIYDTMYGIRGEINFIVKVELFSDANKFRQSSCGVQFFHSNSIPHGYHAIIRGFVEELALDDDPEQQWIDKIRRAASSNEARQIAFMKLAGQIQRKIGLKAINMGGNAVVGYKQQFDLEKDTIVARGIGTCVTLVKISNDLTTSLNNNIPEDENELLSTSPGGKMHARTESIGNKFSASPQKIVSGSLGKDQTLSNIHRRSSDSDLSITPKGNSLTPGYDRNARMPPSAVLKPLNQESMDMLEYPFLTLMKYPIGFIVHFGATVSARSVKLLEKTTEKDEMETRDSWFNELRMEIRGHAKSLGCNVILGYSESTTISDDVTVLSATGTAAVINLQYASDLVNNKDLLLTTSTDEAVQLLEENASKIVLSSEVDDKTNVDDNHDVGGINTSGGSGTNTQNSCGLCHIPYSRSSIHVGGANIGKCCICKRGYVPDVILATIELPEDLPVVGTGCLLQASVCRPKRDLRSEPNAKEISDGLPFLEYELHRLLINKLKVKGMNAIFRLSVQVTVGDKMMALIATGTAVYLSALHPSVVPKIVAGNSWNDSADKLAELQKSIQTTVERNRETYQLLNFHHPETDVKNLNKNFSDTDDSDNDEKLDYAIGNKQTCILEIDDIQDLELFSMLMETLSPDGIQIVNAQSVPGHDSNLENVKNLQMFTQVWRTKIASSHQSNSNFSRQFQRLLQSIFFKLRGAVPCTICEIKFQLDLPADEIQLLITGMVLKTTKVKNKLVQSLSHDKKMEDDMMFSLEEEEDTITEIASPQNSQNAKLQKKTSAQSLTAKPMSKNDKFVDISPLSWVPSGKIEKYLGNLNFSFIRETQNIREYGGVCGFVHSFITELLAIVRAHIAALGGNMMVAFYMTELVLIDNPHKNQAQCLVQVGGDAVYCSYSDDN